MIIVQGIGLISAILAMVICELRIKLNNNVNKISNK